MYPLVTIIVITYNSAPFVLETLESARAQTYRNIELIVSDDGSTDGTIEICREWIARNGVRFVRSELLTVPENTGIPANCNRGVSAAHGEWVKLIAGDDALYPTAIEQNITYLQVHPHISVLFTAFNEFDVDLKESCFIRKRPKSNQRYFYETYSARNQFEHINTKGFASLAPSMFISQATLHEVEGFDERFKLIEDFPLYHKLTNKGIKLWYSDIVTVKYRRHLSAVDSSNNLLPRKESFECYERMREEYVYPQLTTFYLYKHRYYKFLYQSFTRHNLTKKTKLNTTLYFILYKILNPFVTLDFLLSRILVLKISRLKLP